MKILNGCLVLIPDSEDTRAIKQQNQQQQAQLNKIKFKINELVADQKSR
ncbi:toxic protein SymE [Providencia alcalifaciens]|nr:toxic protein SymE [Providencia alcalifaciens]